MCNEKPSYDREKEYCFARDMANQVNAHTSALLITLSAGAIVLGQSIGAIFPFADASLCSKMFLIEGWGFFVFSIISGICETFFRRAFWRKKAAFEWGKIQGEKVKQMPEKSSDLPLAFQTLFFILGVICVFIYASVLLF